MNRHLKRASKIEMPKRIKARWHECVLQIAVDDDRRAVKRRARATCAELIERERFR